MDSELHAHLSSPPDKVISELPVVSSNQILPFEKLTWENFEKLCFQLGCKAMDCLESSYIYGRNGQKQDGIDLYFRKPDETIVWQIKRYQSFSNKDVENAVQAFISGKWIAKANAFILCISCNIDDVAAVDEIDKQYQILQKRNIRFGILDSKKLTTMTAKYPNIVQTFFGTAWKNALSNMDPTSSTSEKEKNWYFQDGSKVDKEQIYTIGDFSARIAGETAYIEQKFSDGNTMYAEFDMNNPGVVKTSKFPYPLSQYEWDIPTQLVLSEIELPTAIGGKNYTVKITKLKWGREIMRFFDAGELVDMTINSPVLVDNKTKVIHILEKHKEPNFE